MMNFIAIHLVSKIEKTLKQKEGVLKHDGFYYFNEPIKDGTRVVNRVNRWAPYIKEQVLPASWYSLKGSILVQIFKRMKDNEFYIYKEIDGKDCKVRLKKNV